MPNCDFFATPEDHEGLLSWLFAEGTCQIYELSSDGEQLLKRFESPSHVLMEFERCHPSGKRWTEVHLKLHVLESGPPFVPRRVPLNPEVGNGATFKYAAEDWGLVQLYLAAPTLDRLNPSHTNHNTKKRAEAWAPVVHDGTDVSAWNFDRITAFSSRLNRQIRKRSVAKIGSRTVLPGALKLWQSGVSLAPYKPGEASLQLISHV